MLFCVSICAPVAAKLLVKDEGSLATGILSIIRPEGLCHVINGGTDRFLNQGALSSSRKARFSDGLGECGDEKFLAPVLGEGGEEGVLREIDLG